MATKLISPAETGIIAFRHWSEQVEKHGFLKADMSEADTRCKLIDPLFMQVLCWAETDIQREEPAAEGFADYSFGTNQKFFHVEAKRVLPRFELAVGSQLRKLQLKGPHLLGKKDIRPFIEQAAKYSPDLGTEFAILTNGIQFIVFQTMVKGRPWREGFALVWHDHADILSDFAAFFRILGKPSVTSGILIEEFGRKIDSSINSFSPIQFVHNPDRELVRNPFWGKISQAFQPVLTDHPENHELQLDIIRKCYVATPLAKESQGQLGRLLRDMMPNYLRDAGVINLPPSNDGKERFAKKLVSDLKRMKPGTYVLTGGVGSGKTTFLRRFARIEQHAYIRDYCVWLHIDFLEIGAIAIDTMERDIEAYTYKRILKILAEDYSSFIPSSGDDLRRIFEEEINDLKLTKLHKLEPDSTEYANAVGDLVHALKHDAEKYIKALMRSIHKAGRCLVFVLDNTDQQGEDFQASVFLFSQKLSENYSTLSIVALREEKFFAANRRGVFDAYGDRKFHIGSPEIIKVIKARLEYGIARYAQMTASGAIEVKSSSESDAVKRVIQSLIEASTIKNGDIIKMISCVSGGNMRFALDLYRDFMSSGNTNINKIMRITNKKTISGNNHKRYRMPFHEFAKSAILGSRRYYKGSAARVTNVFSRASAPDASHWTACRILGRLASARSSPSLHGEGFVKTVDLIREYRESFGRSDDFSAVVGNLLLQGLLESEPPREKSIDETVALKITATGNYYWEFLVGSFAYLDLVFVDTPIDEIDLAKKLAGLAELEKDDYELSFYTNFRIERVKLFVDYLCARDTREIEIARQHGGFYSFCVGNRIKKQLSGEFVRIRKRTGATYQENW